MIRALEVSAAVVATFLLFAVIFYAAIHVGSKSERP